MGHRSNTRKYLPWFLAAAVAIALSLLLAGPSTKKNLTQNRQLRVGYPPVSTSLPLFVALEEQLFQESGLSVEPVQFETANQIVEALVAGRIDATSVSADYPFLAMAQRAPDAFKIFAWEMLDTEIPFDMILSREGSSVDSLEDLEGKTLACFPGSQLRHYATLILNEAVGEGMNLSLVEMVPSNQVAALASGSVDAIFCLEPICTVALHSGVGKVISSSPISKYIGGGNPFPAASFAVASQLIKEDPSLASGFVKAMWEAMDLINEDQEEWRHLYPDFTPISRELAPKIPVTYFAKVADMNIELFQKEADILFDAGLLTKRVEVASLVWRLE